MLPRLGLSFPETYFTHLKRTIQSCSVHQFMLCSPQLSLVLEHSHPPKKKHHEQSLPIALPQPLATTSRLALSVELPVPGASYQRDPTLCGLLCLTPLTRRDVLEVHPRRSMNQGFIPFYS